MSPNVLRWLKELDQQGGDAPEGFDYLAESEEIKRRQPEIEALLGIRMGLCFDQDCARLAGLSLHSEIFWDPALKSNTQRLLIGISFCTFGRIVVVQGVALPDYEQKLPSLYKYLEDSGYAVVGMDVLEEPYSGSDSWPGSSKWTWYSRFFEHL